MKLFTQTLVLVTVLAFSVPGMAKQPGPDRNGPDRQPPPGMEVVEHLHHSLRRLDLDKGQRESIRKEMAQMRETTRPVIEQLHDSRAELHELLLAETYDAKAVANVARSQGEATTKLVTAASESAHRVLMMLTDEQRAELAQMREKRQERMEERLERVERRLERMQNESES